MVDIRGDKVRIGIDAPPDVSVHREEVFDAREAERRSGVETEQRTRYRCGCVRRGATTPYRCPDHGQTVVHRERVAKRDAHPGSQWPQ